MDRARFDYASRYCEENAVHLLDRDELPPPRSIVFISNASRSCPLWSQRAAARAGEPVIWDYHVVLLTEAGAPQLWDLDSTLPFPCDAQTYLDSTFPLAGRLRPELEPRFRVVTEAQIRERFASDRSHMRAPDGTWLAEPPPWPPIRTADATHTLFDFVEMSKPGLGERFDLLALRARLNRQPQWRT